MRGRKRGWMGGKGMYTQHGILHALAGYEAILGQVVDQARVRGPAGEPSHGGGEGQRPMGKGTD